jgi:SpoIID/LytB domain protein
MINRANNTKSTRGPIVRIALCIAAIVILVSVALLALSRPQQIESRGPDASLQSAAETALAERQGTVIVMDPQTGRIRAVVNPDLAYGLAFKPGSTIKPFTALTALRTGVLKSDSRMLCQKEYSHGDFKITCVHPDDRPAFNAEQALAYSCNYFFAKLGEHLSGPAFNSTLANFGFGVRTGAGGETEALGQLPRVRWESRLAVGESVDEAVTPIQLITAYAAIANGGRLYYPRAADADGFEPRLRRQVKLADTDRELLIRGMRGAVEYGTAASANLTQNTNYIFGKTGTSDLQDGIGMQGWFVGFAAPRDPANELPEPNSVGLAVLVFIKGANGRECAATSRAVFDEFARMGSRGEAVARERNDGQRIEPPTRASEPQTVRVHLVTENETAGVPLEEYVLGVLATEASTESELESLKAQAIAMRTYAIKHLHRHDTAGYDFCTTTHCQRFRPVNFNDAPALFARAVNETRGQVLVDQNNELIESYYSASCGGFTADVHDLWGTAPRSYLRANPDQYCRQMPHAEWKDIISGEDLARALAADPRTDVGKRVTDLRVTKRDASARAEFITITGARTRVVRGWDFKMIVGRTLGWNWLKSSRFAVVPAGDGFAFYGQGFGHGLGLCQEGAHVMAERGARLQQILDQYYPGTRVAATRGAGG